MKITSVGTIERIFSVYGLGAFYHWNGKTPRYLHLLSLWCARPCERLARTWCGKISGRARRWLKWARLRHSGDASCSDVGEALHKLLFNFSQTYLHTIV